MKQINIRIHSTLHHPSPNVQAIRIQSLRMRILLLTNVKCQSGEIRLITTQCLTCQGIFTQSLLSELRNQTSPNQKIGISPLEVKQALRSLRILFMVSMLTIFTINTARRSKLRPTGHLQAYIDRMDKSYSLGGSGYFRLPPIAPVPLTGRILKVVGASQ